MTSAGLVALIRYKPGWVFKVGGPAGKYLCVYSLTPDSQKPGERFTQHQFKIPDELDDRDLTRWVFDRLLDCERHEAAEFFTVDGFAPFFPNHQDEGSPYAPVERWETPC